MWNRRMLIMLLASLFVAFGTACGDDSDDDNNGVANNGADAANNGTDAGNNGGADTDTGDTAEDWEYDSEYDLRFTDFEFDEDTPGSELNTVLRSRIEDQYLDYPVVVLVNLRDIDSDEGTLAFRGGAGQKAELTCDPQDDGPCDYEWHEDTTEDYTEGVPFDADTGEFSAQLDEFTFVAAFDAETEATIPITDLTFDANLLPVDADDESSEVAIEDGRLIGVVTKEDADNSEIQMPGAPEPTPLSDLLGEDSMNYDQDGDGEDDAWQLQATFSANEATIVE